MVDVYGGFGVQPKDVCGRVSIWTKDGGSLSQKFGWPVGLVELFGSGLVDRYEMSARLVGLYGSGHGDKEGLLGVLDYLGPAAETSFGVCRAYWTVWVRPC